MLTNENDRDFKGKQYGDIIQNISVIVPIKLKHRPYLEGWLAKHSVNMRACLVLHVVCTWLYICIQM